MMEDEHINVAVRLRPLSDDERASQDRVIVELLEDRSVALQEPNGTVCSSSYDAVFESSASNADVFQLVVRDMLAQALAGKNATVFAYGQTGSGKTHTIEGLMALAASYIFSSISETTDREFLLKLSALEVYNEAVHDLLRRGSGRMELTELKPGRVVVKNVLEESLASAGQLHRLLNNVRDHRKARFSTRTCSLQSMHRAGSPIVLISALLTARPVGRRLSTFTSARQAHLGAQHSPTITPRMLQVRETSHNVNSSRSHQIVTIMVESRSRVVGAGTPGGGGTPKAVAAEDSRSSPDSSTKYSTITFVDLAGSEPSLSHQRDTPTKRQQGTGDREQKREVRRILLSSLHCCSAEHSPTKGRTDNQQISSLLLMSSAYRLY